MDRWIFHVDMDAFYASIEQRDHPEFRGRPVVVGADPRDGLGRGVVAACSYEARRFGIHSALPISQAYRKCPGAVYVRPDMARYREASRNIRAIFDEITDLVEPLSIDEAFLDGSRLVQDPASAVRLARHLKQQILSRERLTASVGIGPSKFIAKIASDLRKPDGLLLIRPEEVQRFLDPLPISRIWGVGPRTEERLGKIGITTVLQLRTIDPATLEKRFGKMGSHLSRLANGIDERPIVVERRAKSISQEHTFLEDTTDRAKMEATLKLMSGKVSTRLLKAHLVARTVCLKLRFSTFRTLTRQVTLRQPTADGAEILGVVLRLLDRQLRPTDRVRLLGVGVASLERRESARQLSLF